MWVEFPVTISTIFHSTDHIGDYELLKGSSEPRFKLLILLNVLSEALSQVVELVVQSHPRILGFQSSSSDKLFFDSIRYEGFFLDTIRYDTI